MSRTRVVPAALVAAALVSGSVMGLSTAHAATGGAAVSVWETTADQSQLLAPQTGAVFAPGGGTGSETITVNPATSYQSMTGFGASLTDSSAWLIANSPQRNAIMTKLFDPNQGIGLDFLRQPIGASDFSLSSYSYDDMPAGQTDPTLANFSVAHDDSYIIPLLQQALKLNPSTTVMATPWSPPGWMKTSGSMVGGTLNTADYQAYANYLVKFLQAYQAQGVPVSLLTAQNEPEYSPSNYPGSTLTASQEATLIGNYLGPALKASGLGTKLLAYDHNWNDTSYPETILGNATAAQYVSGVAWHCYSGDPSAQTTVHDAYPGTDTYFTECSGSQSANPANTFSDSLDWQTENLIIGATRNWAKSVATWNMALNPSGGPSMNCTTCTGVVTVDNTAGTAAYNAEYYSLGQASKFVKPGAVRIDSNTFGSGDVEDVAFQNPDGSDALVVLNSDTANAHTFNVSENGQAFTYTLPAKAVATFTWTPGTSGGGAINPSAWYQVVNTNSGKCVDATGGGTANGTAVQQWSCTGGNTNQEWQFQPTDSGFYKVVTRNAPTEAWDVTGGAGATGNGVPIQLWSYGGGINQQWEPVLNADGSYSFSPRNNTGECLDVTGVSTADGTKLQQWSCTGGVSQKFTLNQVG
ncbi:RICIN domain-containing protein [Streptacidiphilus sp. P02-A3a]|uniref:RICIN domain-containing protein n=1 Tax=Streptacidiphilus sp. P02-A3a TaxID=2704468 RepID=UPI0015FB68A8|nr:RICIN domain-containing protein [Streptacidiphilus sp. P02-A3a]QMU67422.1 glycosyl hydrolase [Streptacidiphilus sp. P02-A3a]